MVICEQDALRREILQVGYSPEYQRHVLGWEYLFWSLRVLTILEALCQIRIFRTLGTPDEDLDNVVKMLPGHVARRAQRLRKMGRSKDLGLLGRRGKYVSFGRIGSHLVNERCLKTETLCSLLEFIEVLGGRQ